MAAAWDCLRPFEVEVAFNAASVELSYRVAS